MPGKEQDRAENHRTERLPRPGLEDPDIRCTDRTENLVAEHGAGNENPQPASPDDPAGNDLVQPFVAAVDEREEHSQNYQQQHPLDHVRLLV